MKLSKNYKNLRASSLLETLIATTIISICVAVAISVFVSVMNISSYSIASMKAKNKMEEMYMETITNQNYSSESVKTAQYIIHKEIYTSDALKNFVRIEFSIEVRGKTNVINRYVWVEEAQNQ